MNGLRRVSGAFVLAALVATGMIFTPARAEAKPDKQQQICSALLTAISYPYLAQSIRDYLIQVYLTQGCDASLLPH
jgi:hypothetical protein